MSQITRLSGEEVDRRRADVPSWQVEDGALAREFAFADFITAFGFMAQVALLAEALDHHPEWSNAYGRVRISLTTHDVGGLSELDFALARRIDALT